MIDAIQFLPTAPDESLLYVGSYSPTWVIISVLLAILASYAALSAATRVEHQRDTTSKLIWTLIGALTLGVGTWAMHFIGMLALNLPCGIYYDPFITLISMIPGILASGVALGVVWHHGTKHLPPLVNSILLGAGIGTMHYTGMAAMRLEGFVRYNPALFVLSIVVAVALSYLALRVKSGRVYLKKRYDALVAVIMGVAVSGMHYTAMSAAYFVRGDAAELPSSIFTTNSLAIIIAITTVFIALAAMALATISRNREITDQLRNSEERWKFALEGAGDGVWDWNPQTDEVLFSKRWKEMIGYDEHEFPDTRTALLEHLHPDDRDRVLSTIQEFFASNQLFLVVEYRMRCKDGSWKWVLTRGKLVSRDDNGNPLRMIGTQTDITERMKAEETVRKNEARFRYMLETSPIAVRIAAAAGHKTLFANQRYGELINSPRDQVIGTDPIQFYANPQDYEDILQQLDKGISITNKLIELKIPDTRPTWALASYFRLEYENEQAVLGWLYDVTDIKEAKDQINQMVFYDALTQLPNRRLLLDRLNHALAASSRDGQFGALLFIDLDHFKTINDTKGHAIGDLLLIEVAKRLQFCVRESDTVSRLSGDEFLVVLETLSTNVDEGATQAEMVAEKIRESLSESFMLKERLSYISSSIGIVVFRGNTENPEDLLRYADTAMYQAKTSGRNTIRFYDSAMQLAIDTRAELNDELHLALKKQQFCLHYQIQVDTLRRSIGAEVLLRWQHPQHGLVSPAQFIQLAEETGLIIPIGLWVLQTACAQLAAWQHDELTRDLSLAVNVSAKQFHEADFVAQVQLVLLDSGAKPSHLKLELTESTMLGNVEDAIIKMHEINMLGVNFSMDDFGTGYSSLQYLKRLPLSQIKIDQSFVRDIVSDPNDASIVQTIIAMTVALGLNVIAEGVENEAQCQFLELSGCQAFQGYLFSKPVPLEDFMIFLKTRD